MATLGVLVAYFFAGIPFAYYAAFSLGYGPAGIAMGSLLAIVLRFILFLPKVLNPDWNAIVEKSQGDLKEKKDK